MSSLQDWQQRQLDLHYDDLYLKDHEFKDWPFVSIAQGDRIRMYIKSDAANYWHEVYFVEWTGCNPNFGDYWDIDAEPTVEVILKAEISHDEARHMYLNPDMQMSCLTMSRIFEILTALQQKLCPNYFDKQECLTVDEIVDRFDVALEPSYHVCRVRPLAKISDAITELVKIAPQHRDELAPVLACINQWFGELLDIHSRFQPGSNRCVMETFLLFERKIDMVIPKISLDDDTKAKLTVTSLDKLKPLLKD